MANSASDARNSELDIRCQLLEQQVVADFLLSKLISLAIGMP